MARDTQEATTVPYSTNDRYSSVGMVWPTEDIILEIKVSLLRHRDRPRRSQQLVHQLHCVLYRTDGSVLHSLNVQGPNAVLAEHLNRVLNLAQHSRNLKLTQRNLRDSKRMRVRQLPTSPARSAYDENG